MGSILRVCRLVTLLNIVGVQALTGIFPTRGPSYSPRISPQATAAPGRLVVENALAATTGQLHRAGNSDDPCSLCSFMQRTPEELAQGLKRHLPQNYLDVEITGEDNVESGLVLSPKTRVYLGPRALGLWMQPKLLLWVHQRRKGRLVIQAACIAGEAAQGLRLTHLSVQTRLTWIESAIDHLQGDAVPCLLMNSKLEVEIDTKAPRLLRLVPPSLLEAACRRTVKSALADMQGEVAAALVEAYEEWCDSWQKEAPVLT